MRFCGAFTGASEIYIKQIADAFFMIVRVYKIARQSASGRRPPGWEQILINRAGGKGE
jgi:hypothetical protein